jgi:DNA polymerase-3 subunit beta
VKFRVERDVLAEAVAWTARSLPSRPPVPVLAGVLVEAESSGAAGLRLSGFDYEVSARVEVDADVSEPGRVLVSGRLLADIARSLPARPVEVVTDGSKVVVTCGNTRFTLLTMPVDDYPTLPTMPTASGTVAGEVFASAVGQVAVAAGRDDTLPVLTGIRVEIDGEKLTLVATDRYRLAARELTWAPEQSGLTAVALVPARTLDGTAKALTSGDKVTVALASSVQGEGLVGFEAGGRRTTTRLLEGEFPKYRTLFPKESTTVARLDTAPFVEAVKRVSLVAERNTPVRLGFRGGECVLEAGTGEEAQASEAIDARLDGDDISIAFNPAFLLDGLTAIDAPVARLAFTIPTKPAVITGCADSDINSDAEQSDYRYLIMPVRLSG